MQKIKLLLDKNKAYLAGAGALLDFAGTSEDQSSLVARRALRRQNGHSGGQSWSKVGADFRAAMQELSRVTQG